MSATRNERIAVLTTAAKAKSQAKTTAAEQAIRGLIKRGEPITFHAVARAADVSHAFLYNHPQLRGRIEHLRACHRPQPQPRTPATPTTTCCSRSPPRSNASRNGTAPTSRPSARPSNKPTERTSTSAANSSAADGHPTTIHRSQQRPDQPEQVNTRQNSRILRDGFRMTS